MKKKIAGIILASVLTFSAMAGVQASAEDRLWETVWRQMVWKMIFRKTRQK